MEDTTSAASSSSSLALHRVRFVDWAPSAVAALAFLPSLQQGGRSILAIGRDNGNIDLCVWTQDDTLGEEDHGKASSSTSTPRVAQGWTVDTTLVGTNSAKIESLAFVQTPTLPYPTPRLFSTSGGASVTENFLPLHILNAGRSSSSSQSTGSLPVGYQTGTSRTIPSHGGSVWSMAASPLGKALAIGCDDGHVRIVDIEDGRFELLSSTRSARRGGDGVVRGLAAQLDRAKTRIVSLAWGPPRRRAINGKKIKPRQGTTPDTSDDDSDDDEDGWEDTFIIGGTTHSSALLWDTSSGRIDGKMLVDKTRKEQTIVWSAATLGDGTCVLGDSLGHVSFFDGKTRTLLPGGRFTSHGKRADVLTLCIGPDGKSVYSASVDQKVCEYSLVTASNTEASDEGASRTAKWILSGKRRLHAHDIRAIAIDPPFDPKQTHTDSSILPVLVSGGTDFNLVMTPAKSPSSLMTLSTSANSKKALAKLKKGATSAADLVNPISSTPVTSFSDTIQRRLPFVPSSGKGGALGGGGVVRICSARRWILLRREKSVGIWALPPSATADGGEGWRKIIEMQVKASSNLTCAEVSPDGRLLFVSDAYESKLFELQGTNDADIAPRRIKSFGRAFATQGLSHCPGASSATFTPDSHRLVLASHPGAYVHVIELPAQHGATTCSLLQSFDEHRRRSTGPRAVAGRPANGHAVNGTGSVDSDSDSEENNDAQPNGIIERTIFERIDTVAVSPDGQYLVSIDTAKRIHVFSLDTLRYSAPLPSPAQRPSSLAFDPWQPHRLTLILPTNRLIVYDLEARASGHDGALKQGRSLTNGRVNGISGHGHGTNANHKSRLDDGFAASIDQKISSVREGAIGGVWLSAAAFLLWGSTWMCTTRRKGAGDNNSTQQNAKRARDGDAGPDKGKAGKRTTSSQWKTQITFKYQPLLFVGTTKSDKAGAADELVVVERPYYDVARGLPPTYFGGTPYGA